MMVKGRWLSFLEAMKSRENGSHLFSTFNSWAKICRPALRAASVSAQLEYDQYVAATSTPMAPARPVSY